MISFIMLSQKDTNGNIAPFSNKLKKDNPIKSKSVAKSSKLKTHSSTHKKIQKIHSKKNKNGKSSKFNDIIKFVSKSIDCPHIDDTCDDDDDDEDEDDDDEDDDDEDEDDDDEDEDEDEDEDDEDEDDEDDEDEDEEEEEEEDEEDGYFEDIYLSQKEIQHNRVMKKLNENTECDSEDEKIFMKDSYQEKNKSKRSDKDKNDKRNKNIDFDAQYKELIELNQYLTSRLEVNPQMKTMKTALKHCKYFTKQFIRNSRKTNATNYYNLIKSKDDECEVDYFKKKLSNTQQQSIIKELKDINSDEINHKPQRLHLLLSNIPLKFKTIVLQKMNSLSSMENDTPDYHKQKNWIDAFLRIPFNIYRNLPVKMDDGKQICNEYMIQAKTTLDNCVYGHGEAKTKILQMIGQ